jgi:hypothetical protein
MACLASVVALLGLPAGLPAPLLAVAMIISNKFELFIVYVSNH